MLVLWSVFVSSLILSTRIYGNLYEDHVDHGIRRMNEIRSWHDAPPVSRHPDPKFDHDAERYAAKLAALAKGLKHSSGMEIDSLGWMENLFGGGFSTNKTKLTISAIEAWYSEIRRYDYGAPHFVAGHFTCSIWRSSKYHSYGVWANKTTGVAIVVGAVTGCNLPYPDSMRFNVRPPMNELACKKSAKVTCDVPNYATCKEPYNDMIRCIFDK